jgi:arginyl-tRNA synthetase
MLKEELRKTIKESLKRAAASGELKLKEFPSRIVIDKPRDKMHGDFTFSLAFTLSGELKKSPREIADIIYKYLKIKPDFIDRVEIAGGGFLNFFVNKAYLHRLLIEIIRQGNKFGRSKIGGNKKIQVEFASVGPTGPVHIGHSRGAVIGDVLSNVLKEAGYRVTKEYYVNDVGTQIDILGKSLMNSYKEILGEKPGILENGYKGQYISDIAATLKDECGTDCLSKDLGFFSSFAVHKILSGIKKDFEDFGVRFDNWINESGLYSSGEVKKTIELLKKRGDTSLRDGALWFADDVIVRSNGVPTYFASDIAYHCNKYKRGFYKIIDIWGQDHHGHVRRVKNAVEFMGYDPENLEIILYQLVSLSRGGEPVKMSTRQGEFITLREVMEEVGRDAIRFFFLMRKSSSHLNFDLELAKSQSLENPVYYVQYAHARICSIFREAAKKKLKVKSPKVKAQDLLILKEETETDVIKKLISFPDEISEMAFAREPQGLTVYLQELAALFHRFYTDNRVISNDVDLTSARLVLVTAIQIVLAKGLRLMGIEPRERM